MSSDNAPPYSGPGTSLPHFLDLLRQEQSTKKNEGAALKAVLRSTHSPLTALALQEHQWPAFVRMALISCVDSDHLTAAEVQWVFEAAPTAFVQRHEAALAKLWPILAAGCHQMVTHLSKFVHTGIENSIYVRDLPSAAGLGHVASGDVLAHPYTTGAAVRYVAGKNLLEAAAWVDGEYRHFFEHVGEPESSTIEALREVGAPDSLLAALAEQSTTRRVAGFVDQRLKQLYICTEEGDEAIISPVPAAATVSFFHSARPHDSRWLARHNLYVGGTHPANSCGLNANANGKINLLSARLPAMRPAGNVLAGVFNPYRLLRRPQQREVRFLLVDTSAWPNTSRAAFLDPRIDALLERVCEPLVALSEHLRTNPTRSPEVAQRLAATKSGLLQVAAGEADKRGASGAAKELLEAVLAPLDGKVPPRFHLEALERACESWVEERL